MKAVFVELPVFERHRTDYLDDAAFRDLQLLLMLIPKPENTIAGTGGRSMETAFCRCAAREKANVAACDLSIIGGIPDHKMLGAVSS